MGLLIDGKWTSDEAQASVASDGSWTRAKSVVRSWVGSADFPVASGRYHLYVAWNCPWAHRVLLTRGVLGLETAIPVSFCAPRRTDQGWVFAPLEGFVDDRLSASALHEVYTAGNASYTGRVTVPLLVDRESGRLVSNESADLVRMLGQSFLSLAERPRDIYPEPLRDEIDSWSERIYTELNNGVYRTGFAESQEAYDAAVDRVFAMLDTLEERLKNRVFVVGDQLTETDLRLFPTLARFDVAYHTAFKCSIRRLTDYPALWAYARRIYALPGVAETVKFDVYRKGYWSKSPKRNPLGIVPKAPDINWAL